MAQKGFRRADRVSERIRSELMELVLRGSVRDPAAKDVVVSAVRMTDDLSIARVYVRVLEEIGSDRQDAVVEALDRASGFLRHEIGQRLQLRHVPKLEFYWDDVVDSALRIESILQEIREDPDAGSEGSK
ncbi:MAG: 30S ribosome-binding factor RbfA [Deltaproteobacteria bacterium]|jgi:ribosome-binding factor A|nr:30S ribosome-binding factor RbfA [Deltaproteobacteria bacterium]MBW1874928.1 30S ribosome-binding factor RbfA [Deltaproteobacteria bacterium]MBW2210952.1 30S ribosome-binding factor RbfA [Deltaproteobacteria bacterium]MBW2213560.1 30S ribosome-binding factor RbfA [Deltaproteobacteria bacterium]MBW2550509.1 30S ribosome-binding factor RbfA [Deltaproteobacteria bacterium]